MLDNPPPFQQRQMPGATGQQTAPVDDIDDAPEELASAEEQAAYDKLMPIAYDIMADEKAFPMLEKMLSADPLNAIADATLTVLDALEKQEGEQNPDVLMALAEEIIPNLAELAEGMGTDIPEDQLEQVMASAIAKWSEAHPERVDQEGLRTIGSAAITAIQGEGGGDVQAG